MLEVALNISHLHQEKLIEKITHFVKKSSGLTTNASNEFSIQIQQLADGKSLPIHIYNLHNVILRKDSQNRNFIQVDFVNGYKILITQLLIGFKPYPIDNLDMKEVPNVVTTPDLHKVFQTLEEAIALDENHIEVEILNKIFRSILKGGQNVGFDLKNERAWFHRLSYFTATA